ncbi:outer membrane beta-barrel protein [Bradyrhizobium sp. AS23.2]|uniref:outer membrane protein n=1 Tax=Bradyrhizobium sp. AS23.2 TaxID=1680155 RepID=UPI00093952AC|nr:outer membrane beta-barrel protein [Bradyrhizobium sp. AS23.2]OKO70487.1 hypothetical protein AC630_34850 [Bradyrhizobium sp. AS23.2]
MKVRLAVGIAAAAMCSAPALASDLPARTYTKAPPPVVAPVPSWAGFYIGGHVGGARGPDVGQSWAELPGPNSQDDPVFFGRASATNVIGGAHAGYNWQASPNWMFGVEGDFSWTSLDATARQSPMTFNGAPLGAASFVTMNSHIDWLASVRGRVGYVWAGNWMAYVTGGVAFERQKFFGNSVFPNTAFNGSVAFDDTKTGWIAGAGVEFLAAQNWMFRFEYLYYGFDGTSATVLENQPSGPATGNPLRFSWSDNNVKVVRAGLSYKFGGPVVAKY